MKKTYTLETVDEVIHAFRPYNSAQDDTLPCAGQDAVLRIVNGKISIENSLKDFIVSGQIDSDELLIAICKRQNIDLVFGLGNG